MTRWPLLLLGLGAIVGLGYWASATATEREPAGRGAGSAVGPRVRPQGGAMVGAVTAPNDLNPFTTQEQVARRFVLRYTHDTLLDLDPQQGTLRPAAAITHERLDDGRRVRFTLRPDLRFADGTVATVEDALFAYRAGRSADLPLGAFGIVMDYIADVAALDERRFDLVLTEPTRRALGLVATGYPLLSRAFFVGAAAQQAEATGTTTAPGEPGFGAQLRLVNDPGPGTGPYALPRDRDGRLRRPVDRLDLVANPHAWHRAARPASWNLATLRLLYLADPAARRAALRRQEIDWLVVRDPTARLADDPALAKHYRGLSYDHLYGGTYLIVWNHRRPGLDDARSRRALTHLFDRRAIAMALFAGAANPPAGWFPPGSPFAPPDAAPLEHDPAAARRLLEQVAATGATPPQTLSLIHATEAPEHARIAELVQPSFAKAGLDLQLEPMPWPQMRARLDARDFDGMLLVLSGDPWQEPYAYFHSSQTEVRNWMGYHSERADRLLAEARTTSDAARRTTLLRELATVLRDDQPVTLVARPRTNVLLHRRFRDAEPTLLGLVPETWWVPEEEQRQL
ncbi:MAG: ABC transporter substrate-binding protein [Planctomycetota bacterium]